MFATKLEPQLRANFTPGVAGENRPASQVVRELMRGHIEQRRPAGRPPEDGQGGPDRRRPRVDPG